MTTARLNFDHGNLLQKKVTELKGDLLNATAFVVQANQQKKSPEHWKNREADMKKAKKVHDKKFAELVTAASTLGKIMRPEGQEAKGSEVIPTLAVRDKNAQIISDALHAVSTYLATLFVAAQYQEYKKTKKKSKEDNVRNGGLEIALLKVTQDLVTLEAMLSELKDAYYAASNIKVDADADADADDELSDVKEEPFRVLPNNSGSPYGIGAAKLKPLLASSAAFSNPFNSVSVGAAVPATKKMFNPMGGGPAVVEVSVNEAPQVPYVSMASSSSSSSTSVASTVFAAPSAPVPAAEAYAAGEEKQDAKPKVALKQMLLKPGQATSDGDEVQAGCCFFPRAKKKETSDDAAPKYVQMNGKKK